MGAKKKKAAAAAIKHAKKLRDRNQPGYFRRMGGQRSRQAAGGISAGGMPSGGPLSIKTPVNMGDNNVNDVMRMMAMQNQMMAMNRSAPPPQQQAAAAPAPAPTVAAPVVMPQQPPAVHIHNVNKPQYRMPTSSAVPSVSSPAGISIRNVRGIVNPMYRAFQAHVESSRAQHRQVVEGLGRTTAAVQSEAEQTRHHVTAHARATNERHAREAGAQAARHEQTSRSLQGISGGLTETILPLTAKVQQIASGLEATIPSLSDQVGNIARVAMMSRPQITSAAAAEDAEPDMLQLQARDPPLAIMSRAGMDEVGDVTFTGRLDQPGESAAAASRHVKPDAPPRIQEVPHAAAASGRSDRPKPPPKAAVRGGPMAADVPPPPSMSMPPPSANMTAAAAATSGGTADVIGHMTRFAQVLHKMGQHQAAPPMPPQPSLKPQGRPGPAFKSDISGGNASKRSRINPSAGEDMIAKAASAIAGGSAAAAASAIPEAKASGNLVPPPRLPEAAASGALVPRARHSHGRGGGVKMQVEGVDDDSELRVDEDDM